MLHNDEYMKNINAKGSERGRCCVDCSCPVNKQLIKSISNAGLQRLKDAGSGTKLCSLSRSAT